MTEIVDAHTICASSLELPVRIYDPRAAKRATNLSINNDLLRRARELGINLSSEFERALERVVKRRLAERWRAENRRAIASYNEHVAEHGVFSDGVRRF